MLSHDTQHDGDPVIQDFFNWYGSAKRPGSRKTPPQLDASFVPFTSVEAYLSKPLVAERLLGLFFSSEDPWRPDAEAIRRTHGRVFCILLCINKAHLISRFVQSQQLRDLRLPFRESDLTLIFQDKDFCVSFIARQWEFCAQEIQNVKFGLDDKQWILPITDVEKLGDGGSAVIHKITIHEAYDLLDSHRRGPPVSVRNEVLLNINSSDLVGRQVKIRTITSSKHIIIHQMRIYTTKTKSEHSRDSTPRSISLVTMQASSVMAHIM